MSEITETLQFLVLSCTALLMKIVEKKRAECRTERQCIDCRNQNGYGKGKCKLPVENSRGTLKKTYRQKYRGHNKGDGNNCFCYLPHG